MVPAGGIELPGGSDSHSPVERELNVPTGPVRDMLDQARAVVEVRAAEEPARDRRVLNRALTDAVNVAEQCRRMREYLHALLEHPELDIQPRQRPPLESIRHRNDLELLFWAKTAVRYAQYRFPTNTLKRSILESIVYNYLVQQRDRDTATGELLDDPTSELATLNYQIQDARHNNYRTVLGPKHLRDLDEIAALYHHLQRSGAQPDFDRLPALAKLEQRFQQGKTSLSGISEGGVPSTGSQITTEADINRLLSITLKQARIRSRNEQPASDGYEPLVTNDELDEFLTTILRDPEGNNT